MEANISAKIVNLFAGPGAGKSTIAALTFGALKTCGINAELVTEFAKDLTWEGRTTAIEFQPYVAAKQMFRIHRLLNHVEVIITDSPLLLSIYYNTLSDPSSRFYFNKFIEATHCGWDTMNYFIERDSNSHPYNTSGRCQSEDEAIQIDQGIRDLLDDYAIDYISVPARPLFWQPEQSVIVSDVVRSLNVELL